MKLLYGILLLAASTVLVMGQVVQISFSQNTTNETGLLPIPEFEPRTDVGDIDNSNLGTVTREPEPEPASDRIAAQIELEPEGVLEDYYTVSNFAINTMEASELCPTGNCDIDLEDGQMNPAFTYGERLLFGKLRIDTGESSRILDLSTSWETVEEREGANGETVQYIEGTLAIGQDVTSSEFEYRINGTMTQDGDNYLVVLHGER
jgi:hypothetical protein